MTSVFQDAVLHLEWREQLMKIEALQTQLRALTAPSHRDAPGAASADPKEVWEAVRKRQEVLDRLAKLEQLKTRLTALRPAPAPPRAPRAWRRWFWPVLPPRHRRARRPAGAVRCGHDNTAEVELFTGEVVAVLCLDCDKQLPPDWGRREPAIPLSWL
ncbi:hypothetical protein GCM10022252_75100 [Streptosporangium oxazolinicum]|uniref:Uncharacterized protein n=1 Tax=Streptosporangium oxazolinicum TaxID=909287 RepID=A0ABP8BKF6_9ACTN